MKCSSVMKTDDPQEDEKETQSNLSLTGTNMDYGQVTLGAYRGRWQHAHTEFPRPAGAGSVAPPRTSQLALLHLECFGTVDADVMARCECFYA